MEKSSLAKTLLALGRTMIGEYRFGDTGRNYWADFKAALCVRSTTKQRDRRYSIFGCSRDSAIASTVVAGEWNQLSMENRRLRPRRTRSCEASYRFAKHGRAKNISMRAAVTGRVLDSTRRSPRLDVCNVPSRKTAQLTFHRVHEYVIPRSSLTKFARCAESLQF